MRCDSRRISVTRHSRRVKRANSSFRQRADSFGRWRRAPPCVALIRSRWEVLDSTQVAGMNQAFRIIIPESVAGPNAGAAFETWGGLLEQNFGPRTYLAVGGEWLQSEVDREVGAFDFVPFSIARRQTREELD